MENGHPSRRRLLDAAAAEFAAFGIAGARVDRIAAAARVNKSQLYAYFGSKSGLFDAVLGENLAAITGAAPLTADDLPGYAARLYDSYVAHPQLPRLAAWARLERTSTGGLFVGGDGLDPDKLRAIAAAQEEGLVVPDLTPAEVLAVVSAISMTWSPISITFAASHDDAASEHTRRRSVIAGVVARAFAPTAGPPSPVERRSVADSAS